MSTETTAATRIRWEPNDDGAHVTPAYEGYVGTISEPQFFIFEPDDRDPWWIMTSSLPGLPGAGQAERRSHSDDTDQLKAEAEHWLEEFASSLGAIFPAPPLPADNGHRHLDLTCGACGEEFGTNCADDDIRCTDGKEGDDAG